MDERIREAIRGMAEENAGATNENPAFWQLMSGPNTGELLERIELLHNGTQAEREFAARALANVRIPSPDRLNRLRRLLKDERDPKVIRWLVGGLRNVRDPSALANVRNLVQHPSPHVRFVVPDALSACAASFDDVADDLLRLSRDADPDVRWSAVFELAEWLTDVDDARILSRLSELADSDESEDVRYVAANAVAQQRDDD
ncbi:MAG: HEAT repeat domain-containing protein [Nitriliruptorales bacterium]|nr:HEAT repeat domain-containing protein [Nitriliruptorales bacterium]